MKHLADDYSVVVQSPNPENVYCYSPGLLKTKSGRIIATMDFGGVGVKDLEASFKYRPNDNRYFAGRVFVSDDNGLTWCEKAKFPLMHSRPFKAGNSFYIIGHSRNLGIVRSDDNGETWSEVSYFTEDQHWHQAPCNVWYEEDRVYLVMERMTHQNVGWPVCGIAPVLMRANINDDLTKRENWTFASELVFEQNVVDSSLVEFGLPFHKATDRCGWLETNVVRLKKENDFFYDKTGKTLHLFMRSFTGLPWTGALLKVIEKDDGSMETMFETAPSGKRMTFINIPGGGESKFHILYDEKTRTYWLLTNQFTDRMVDLDKWTYNQRHGYDRSRLALYYSYNCFDWLFAGVVTAGKTRRQARSYASMAFDGDDLIVLSRTGVDGAINGHDTNCITFHRVKDFRSLIDIDFPEE